MKCQMYNGGFAPKDLVERISEPKVCHLKCEPLFYQTIHSIVRFSLKLKYTRALRNYSWVEHFSLRHRDKKKMFFSSYFLVLLLISLDIFGSL